MTNQTLTPVSIVPGNIGWEVVDGSAQKWWIPPADKKTGVSNEEFAKFIQENLGKPVELNTWVKENGSRFIFGKAESGGGGGRGMSPQDRAAERNSIQAQTALKAGVELLTAFPGLADNKPLAWLEMAVPRLAALIRTVSGVPPADQKSVEAAKEGGMGKAVVPTTSTDAPPALTPPPGAGTSPGESPHGAPSPGDFIFTGGAYANWHCWEVVAKDPAWLQAHLDKLKPENRAIAEALLAASSGGDGSVD
jgi:hypothetical protein